MMLDAERLHSMLQIFCKLHVPGNINVLVKCKYRPTTHNVAEHSDQCFSSEGFRIFGFLVWF